eukprot:5113864-Pleurochrysis_carterae.AAC.1
MIGKSKEGKETWVDERNCAPVKFDAIKQFKAIENSDGCAHGKQLDRFLNLHSTTFKALGLKSVIQCRKYALAGKFVANVQGVVLQAQLEMRRAAKATAGGRGIAQPDSSAAGAQENHSAELDTVANMKAELQLTHEQLLDCAPYYNAPLTQ